MVMEIEKASGRSPAGRSPEYDYLFEMGNRVQESQNKEIEDLLLQITVKDSDNHLRRKIVYLDSRALTIYTQTDVSNKKANLFRENGCLYVDGAAAACLVAGGIFGGSGTAIGQGFSQVFSATSNDLNRRREAGQEGLSHSYQCYREVIGSYSQGMQSADKGLDQSANMLDRAIQNSRKQAEVIAQ